MTSGRLATAPSATPFGSHAIRTADSREVMEWMGHQDLATTQRYLQFKSRQDAARRISAAFRDSDASELATTG